MRIVAIGDICAAPGRTGVELLLPRIKRDLAPDFIIANGENAAQGFGLTRSTADELFASGIDILTGGNHIFDKRDIYNFIDSEPRVLRPANYPPGTPGRGWTVVTVGATGYQLAIINLSGRAFMNTQMDCPFREIDVILQEIPKEVVCKVVDIHAETTSEKRALGWYLDGRVSALWGTHTHVATADEAILPQGTAYISDIGMTGVEESVLGMRIDQSTERLTTSRPVRLEPVEGVATLNGIVVDLQPQTGKALYIARIRY
ncbi:MAG: TIGR00282 family metallophosphoesterase [Symbiobacteriaceae bacterium]|nr:TIGR00282 family metallophosphoesterase [Symbiobacteriaceae bacterium]